jgi:hypothetical protein
MQIWRRREARIPGMATEDSTRRIAAEWWEEFREFRTTHPPKRVTVDGVGWEYIASGGGEEDLLILPGGAMVAEAGFTRIPALKDRYRVIAPSSDGVTPGLGSTRSAAPGTLPG